jgi:capsid protein
MSDVLSARAANSFQVRRQLRMRSRYEVSNNPYLFGICCDNANHLIGTGPRLKCLRASEAENRQIERAWEDWASEVELVEKWKTQKLAREVDGEGYLVLKSVAELESPVKLYPVDLEADQFTTYSPANQMELWIDGLVLHPVTQRPVSWDVLDSHPGDYFFPGLNPLSHHRIAARYVLHWFRKFRPGQVRGLPVFTSALDLFTELRSFRRAALAKAQIAANLTAVLQTEGPPAVDDGGNPITPTPWEVVQIDRGTMSTLPANTKLFQFAEGSPPTSYGDYHQTCLGEACRPLSFPLNLALGTSQKFNFSSAQLDYINYDHSLDLERTEQERAGPNPLLRAWVDEAALVPGLLPRGVRSVADVPHEWHWPGHPSRDPVKDATADHSRLSNGTLTLREFWAKRGYDWREVLAQQGRERDEVERLELVFGDPLKKTERTTDDASSGTPPAAARRRPPVIRAYSDDQPRDDKGRFGTGGVGKAKEVKEARNKAIREAKAKAMKAVARVGAKSWEGIKKAGAVASHCEHVAVAWAKDKVEAGILKLPARLQPVARGTLRVAAVGGKVAFATHLAGQKAAELVARERGLTHEAAKALRGTLASVDLALCKPVTLSGELLGGRAAGLALSMVPVASMGYLAYSTARDPMATLRAGRGAVRSVGKRLGLMAADTHDPLGLDLARQIGDRYAARSGAALDTYMAYLHAALDEFGDLATAIRVADLAEAEVKAAGGLDLLAYSDDQPRDDKGRFGEGGGAPAEAHERAKAKAAAKIAAAPVPSSEAVEKARAELAKAKAGLGRAGGESRGGSAAARRKQRESLFNEFQEDHSGYVVCHETGIKMHWSSNVKDNPNGYPTFERGKIFTKTQGGGYQLKNLIPESFAANRGRSDKPIRTENLDAAAGAGHLRGLAGKRVQGKRLGWHEPPEGALTAHDMLDPPAWRDDGLAEDLEGVLRIHAGDGATAYLVDGQEADPLTIVLLPETDAASATETEAAHT